MPGIDKDEQKALKILLPNYVNVTQKVNMSGFHVLSRTFVTKTIFYIDRSGGKQKFHIIPAFRGFKIPGLNLAETGHSMIKTKNKMWLSMATHRDVYFFIIQDLEHIGTTKHIKYLQKLIHWIFIKNVWSNAKQ